MPAPPRPTRTAIPSDDTARLPIPVDFSAGLRLGPVCRCDVDDERRVQQVDRLIRTVDRDPLLPGPGIRDRRVPYRTLHERLPAPVGVEEDDSRPPAGH